MFDFTKTFEFMGKMFVRALKLGIRQQTGIDGTGYSPAAPSTARGRGIKTFRNKSESKNAKTGKPKTFGARGLSLKRLFVTGEFSSGAFNYIADKGSLTVFAPETMHRGGATMADIVRYNSRGQARVNDKIKNPPLVFPNNAAEIAMIKDSSSGASVLERGGRMLRDEIVRQLRERGTLVAKKELQIG